MKEITNFRKYLNEGQLNEGSTTKFYAFDDNEVENGYLLQNITGKSEDEIIKHIKHAYFATFVRPNMEFEEVADEIEEKIENETDNEIEVILSMGSVSIDTEDGTFEDAGFTFYEYVPNEE